MTWSFSFSRKFPWQFLPKFFCSADPSARIKCQTGLEYPFRLLFDPILFSSEILIGLFSRNFNPLILVRRCFFYPLPLSSYRIFFLRALVLFHDVSSRLFCRDGPCPSIATYIKGKAAQILLKDALSLSAFSVKRAARSENSQKLKFFINCPICIDGKNGEAETPKGEWRTL